MDLPGLPVTGEFNTRESTEERNGWYGGRSGLGRPTRPELSDFRIFYTGFSTIRPQEPDRTRRSTDRRGRGRESGKPSPSVFTTSDPADPDALAIFLPPGGGSSLTFGTPSLSYQTGVPFGSFGPETNPGFCLHFGS